MRKKTITGIFIGAMIIFLPLSFYLVKNHMISLLVRNIIFGCLIVGYLLGMNFSKK